MTGRFGTILTLSWTYDLVSYVSGVKWLLGACCVSTLHEVKEQQELQQHSGDTAAAVGTKLWQHYFDYGDVTSTVEKSIRSSAPCNARSARLARVFGMTKKWYSPWSVNIQRLYGMPFFRLLRNREVVFAAFEQDPRALLLAIAKSSGRRALERQRDCMRLFYENYNWLKMS